MLFSSVPFRQHQHEVPRDPGQFDPQQHLRDILPTARTRAGRARMERGEQKARRALPRAAWGGALSRLLTARRSDSNTAIGVRLAVRVKHPTLWQKELWAAEEHVCCAVRIDHACDTMIVPGGIVSQQPHR